MIIYAEDLAPTGFTAADLQKGGKARNQWPAIEKGLIAFERFFERVHDQPEHAAHLAQKTACDVADSLGNQNGWISVCHGRETWPYLSMGKRGKFSRAKTYLGECATRFRVAFI